jgi:spore germination protein YaaH
MQPTTPLYKRLSLALIVTILGLTLLAALPQPAQAATCEDTYTVKEVDNIYSIARKFKIPATRLAKANNLTEPYTLKIGQKLCVPGPSTYTNAKFTSSLTDTGLGVNGDGFRKNVLFYVRVRENDSSSFVKLGNVKSDKLGKINARLQLPKDLQKKNALTVCLKNAFKDDILCTRALRR